MAEPAEKHEHHFPFDPSAFYKHTTLEELVAGKEPITSMDQFVIDDLTEEEWKAFQEVLKE